MSKDSANSESPPSHAQKKNPYTRDRIILIIGLVTYGIGQSLLYTVFPAVGRDLGVNEMQQGWIMSISNLVLALCAPIWGKQSDKFGRKPIMLLGMAGYLFGTLFFALGLQAGISGWIQSGALFYSLLLARLFYGTFASAIQPAVTAYIADTTTEENRAQGMALMGMTTGLGTIIGPLIGALAVLFVVLPLYIAVAMAVIGFLLILKELPEPKVHKHDEDTTRTMSPFDSRILPFLILWAVYFMAFTTMTTITQFYLEDRIGFQSNESIITATMGAFIAMALTTVIMQGVVLQKVNLKPSVLLRLYCPTYALSCVTFLLAGYMPITSLGFAFVLVSYALFGMAFSFAAPGINGGASLSVKPHEQGMVGGYLASASVMGMVIGPLLGPYLYTEISPVAPMVVSAICLGLLGVYSLTIKVPDPTAKASKAPA